jgi:outer membrane cobalamin receptor
MIVQGGAKALDVDTNTTVELDAAVDLNVKASYFLSKQFSIFLKGSNLLANEYQLFLNYPVRGLQVMGGIIWVF